MSRFAQEWWDMLGQTGNRVCRAFGLPFPIDPLSDEFPACLALIDLGIGAANVIAEPRLRISAEKRARDAELGRPTIHAAPTWRHPDADETGTAALILPVSLDWPHSRAMSLRQAGSDEAFAARIADMIAIPLDGSRPLSRTGHTLAVGPFNVAKERLVLHAGGKAWLDAHLAQAHRICADTPAHLVPKLHFPLPPPDDVATLMIEPMALEWRVTAAGCVIPHAARHVDVADSRALAGMIDNLMRQRERTRPLPVVRGPRAGAQP